MLRGARRSSRSGVRSLAQENGNHECGSPLPRRVPVGSVRARVSTDSPDLVVHARLLIEGRVQGVGYRWFAMRAARELGVRGWVRNLRDGRVEAQVAAPAYVLEDLLGRLRRGPVHARVDRIEVEPLHEDPDFEGFTLRD